MTLGYNFLLQTGKFVSIVYFSCATHQGLSRVTTKERRLIMNFTVSSPPQMRPPRRFLTLLSQRRTLYEEQGTNHIGRKHSGFSNVLTSVSYTDVSSKNKSSLRKISHSLQFEPCNTLKKSGPLKLIGQFRLNSLYWMQFESLSTVLSWFH